MKRLSLFIYYLFLITMISCVERSVNVKKDDVIGYWSLTEESSQQMNSTNESKNELISKFQLKADSSATISFGDPGNGKELSGLWKWNVEKQLGNKSFGIGIRTDVLITVEKTKNSILKLGLRLDNRNGKIFLSVGDRVYAKQ